MFYGRSIKMSYEGYDQVLCKHGHYETYDVYANDLVYWRCSTCGHSAKWWNPVDLTNGSYDDDGTRIDGYVHLRILKEYTCACTKCGLMHFHKPTIYEIPKNRGHIIKN